MKIVFCVKYETRVGENVCVVGSMWNSWKDFVPMSWSKGGLWSCIVTLSERDFIEKGVSLEYKYVVVSGSNLVWESSDNRKVGPILRSSCASPFSFVVLMDVWSYPLCTKAITSNGLVLSMLRERERPKRKMCGRPSSITRCGLAM